MSGIASTGAYIEKNQDASACCSNIINTIYQATAMTRDSSQAFTLFLTLNNLSIGIKVMYKFEV